MSAERQEGLDYAPKGKARRACNEGEFPFAAVALDHGHINGMCNGLTEAGATLAWVFDPDPEKVAAFQKHFPGVRVAKSLDDILSDPEIRMVAGAAVPNERGPLGCRVLEAGKDYFTDKTPFTEFRQLEEARKVVSDTGRKYMVYYSERLHVESAIHTGNLIAEGAIGRVIQVIGMGPHRLSAHSRPGWFFEKAKYGGILCDIGSHQCEQFLSFAGCQSAEVVASAAGNYGHPDFPELEDFGECALLGDNGARGYFRVDWFTPDGLKTWGDGRTFILGTEGTIELRKYTDLTTSNGGDQLLLVDARGEHRIACRGTVGFPFFGALIRDCLDRTENAMTQEHAFEAARLCLEAQAHSDRLRAGGFRR